TSTHDVKLQELVQVLQNMKSFIEVITQCNTSQKFLGTKTKTIEKGFKDLCKEYNNIISLLKFDDLKKNQRQDKTTKEDRAMKEDIKELLEFQVLTKKTITKILDGVTNLCKTAQHNKNISKILAER